MAACFGDSQTINQNLRLGLSISFFTALLSFIVCVVLMPESLGRWFHILIYILGIVALFEILTGTIYVIGTSKMRTPYLDNWDDDNRTVSELKEYINETKHCRRNITIAAFIISILIIIFLYFLTPIGDWWLFFNKKINPKEKPWSEKIELARPRARARGNISIKRK